jgi:PAS domain S-box-containing protein
MVHSVRSIPVALVETRAMPDTANLDARLDLLLRLVDSITASPDLDEVLDRVVRSVTTLVADSMATLWATEGARLVARTRAGARRRPDTARRSEFRFGEGLVGHAAQERRTLLVPDVGADPRTIDVAYFAAEGVVACVAIPLVSHGRLMGVLTVVARRAGDLGPTEVQMLAAFAGHAAIAVESARLYADAEEHRREAETLADVARELAECRDLDTVLASIVRGASALCAADITALALRDPDGVFSARHVIGARTDRYRGFRVAPGLGLGGRTVVSRRPGRVGERAAWPPMPADYVATLDAEGIHSALVVPIVIGHEVEGLLYVCSRAPRFFGADDETALVRLADHAAAAIHTSHLFAAEQEARQAAQASAQSFQDLVDTLDAIVVEGDAETFQVAFVNRRAEAILGYPRQAWYADPAFWANHVHPDDRGWVIGLCQAAAAEGRDHVMQYRMVAADGRVVWLHDMVRVLPGGADGRRQVRSVTVDITERKRAESLLAGEREILELIAAGAPLAQVLEGICRLIESLGDGALASVLLVEGGRLRHGAAPSLPASYVRAIEGLPIGPGGGSCGAAAARREAVVVADIAGDERWAAYRDLALGHGLRACWSSPVLDAGGVVLATFAIYHRVPCEPCPGEVELVARATQLVRIVLERDRTTQALQQSEERYRTLITHIPAVTWLADACGRTVFVSPNTAQITGVPAEEQTAVGEEGWFARIHPDDVASVRAQYTALVHDGAPFDVEYRMQHRDGRWIWVHDRAVSTYEQAGVVYAAGVCADVTQRKQAELEVQQQRQLLTHLTRVATLGELSGALAHELNQPLTAILSNAQAAQRLLAREPVQLDEVREILDDIAAEDRRAGEVIRRLRALLRRGETPRQPLDVNEVTGDVLRLARSELVAHGVSVTTQLAPGLPPVQGDRVGLQQVLLNLIINACDAMRLDAPARRQLTVVTEPEGQVAVRIAIADRGPGLPLDTAERVFEPFFTTKEHGLGLGLVICRSIVATHGGRLVASNNAEGGATFSFVLPRAEP